MRISHIWLRPLIQLTCCWFNPACRHLLLGLLQWGTNSAKGLFRWLMADKKKNKFAFESEALRFGGRPGTFHFVALQKIQFNFSKGTQLLLTKVRGHKTQTHTQYVNIIPFLPLKNCILKFFLKKYSSSQHSFRSSSGPRSDAVMEWWGRPFSQLGWWSLLRPHASWLPPISSGLCAFKSAPAEIFMSRCFWTSAHTANQNPSKSTTHVHIKA